MGAQTTTKDQVTQEDPDSLRRLGGWLFRNRTSIPLPIVAALLLVPASASPSSFSTSQFGLGVLLVAAGEAIRLWAVHHIGAISRTRSDRLGPLIATGPFALVRNPLYLGSILLWLGFAVTAHLLWLAPIILLLLVFEYHAIVRWEETLLAERLGDSYRRYMQRVPRWLPKFGIDRSGAVARSTPAPGAFSWRDTIYSERGTLIAIATGFALLAIKQALGFRL